VLKYKQEMCESCHNNQPKVLNFTTELPGEAYIRGCVGSHFTEFTSSSQQPSPRELDLNLAGQLSFVSSRLVSLSHPGGLAGSEERVLKGGG